MNQIALPLTPEGHGADTQLIVTRCNQVLVTQFENAAKWPFHTGILIGPDASGKSSMGTIFAQQHDGVFIDDADSCSDEELFHAWNHAQQHSQSLLLASRCAPAEWGIKLPDLLSRLGASQMLWVGPPDDEMRAALLQKLLAKRGLAIGDKLVQFALLRLERSYAAIHALAAELDRLTLERKTAIGQRLVAEAAEAVSAQMDLTT
ncbi:DnaA/Hda family protein [Sphingorhabdus sp. Alg239-R122]|uniref:DnaA ATPase domain-containing protein n=1 Tax=Sphingorhabdus sp. Alg239-R122 TaxID=2305989 RepID=UPI0013D9D2A9|nr:DnaA/Hda family protein [Sphingorhabdus sp. Alg239-R122]